MTGNFAFSKAGHDKGKLYVIVAEEQDYVYLCDGRLKKIDAPKKKRKKHIQIVNRRVGEELLAGLEKRETMLDEQIKYAIKQYEKEKE
ncbi:MAG TPA: KOW domain-containing RNA-binding protein [Candidatus Acetatifactor stercoripullorum]|uniref:KOW domain-containing RNA-binding protein n=1 Tax=Candidatus Acetatifactor stercoripullorum TaxID=2838414 RepID=A0A9D1R3G3_9FIRM|nr:KOW domain-containing RNA-binding protein [Candidatus Acetatifactor stercoripullorum]HIW80282.1 KOW domain-containing RNA-binding protein [Candidatus Acetatifactor stercoripullorum]